jgi:hypothetical protein
LEPLNILRAQLEKSQSEQESQQLITSAKTSLVQAKQVLNELETKQDTISQQVTATHARMVGLAQEFNALSEQLALKAKELNQCSREHQNYLAEVGEPSVGLLHGWQALNQIPHCTIGTSGAVYIETIAAIPVVHTSPFHAAIG